MKPDVIATVLEVACLTEDRAPVEQRAMLELALWTDNERARFRGWGEPPMVPYLTALVDATYDPSDNDRTETLFGESVLSRRAVELTAAQQEQLAKLHRKFVPCEKCGVFAGAHALACLERDLAKMQS